jgi:hypothetical protein
MVKGMGPATFGALLDALGLSGTLYVDPAKVARMGRRWQRRREAGVREPARLAKAAIARARPLVMAEPARRGGKARWAGATDEQRRVAVRQLAEARQRKAMSRHMGESVSSA